MAGETAEARGRVMIRPWRVGLVIDVSSPIEVRGAIANLSSVWGGVSMPIFDASSPIPALETAGSVFDVDSLYADHAEGPLGELLAKHGWAWGGRGEWGPFGGAEDGTFRKGLLRVREFLDSADDVVLPGWDTGEPADLALAAIWGLSDRLGMSHELVPLASVMSPGTVRPRNLGLLAMSTLHMKDDRGPLRGGTKAIYVLRPDHPEDIVDFWNLRAYGGHVVGVPSQVEPGLARLLLSGSLPLRRVQHAGATAFGQELTVIGFENASVDVATTIQDIASKAEVPIRQASSPGLPSFRFRGLETSFTRTIRADFRPESRWIDIDLPGLPLVERPDARLYSRGAVAAEVELRDVHGQDPRLTSQMPPYRRHSSLLEHLPFVQEAERIRCGYDGVVLRLAAAVQDVRVPFAFNLDVLRVLFDDDSVTADQSDVGKFQTRAAEKFGGPYSGLFCQPGVRAAVLLAARKPAGVTLPHLRNEVERQRGGWPDPVMEGRITPSDYAAQAVNSLLFSGLFVPSLRVHCSSCRVESYVSADQLGSTMLCEFCGASFNLSLSHSLSRPDWRYRLAAHLRADQLEALLPALATTALLQQLRFTSDPPPLVLGFRVTVDGRTVEADVATYLGDNQYVAVLGEVKSHNRIDSNDIANLKFLRDKLRDKGVRCLLLFATMKDQFTAEEAAELRSLAEESVLITASMGQLVLDLPLVLTGPDLSHHYWDENHPWRWEKNNAGGVFETAMISCKRNLGLQECTHNPSMEKGGVSFVWDDLAVVPPEQPASPPVHRNGDLQ